MEYKKYYAIIEALLFASGEAMPIARLAQTLEVAEAVVRNIVNEMMDDYNATSRGIMIIDVDDAYQLCTKSEFDSYIKTALIIKRNTPLSQAAMETLAIVAYNEPVTKSFVEQVRGVESSQLVNNLVEKGLLEEAGRLDVPGRPISYKTTKNFLRSFKLKSLEELPPVPNQDGQVMLEEVLRENKQNKQQ